MKLSNKCAVVTGGRTGIGRAIVEAFLFEGASVTTCGRGKRPADLPKACGYEQVNVADSTEVQQFANTFEHIDILVNNAGVQVEKTVIDSSDDDWDNVMGVNARGVFSMCRACLPLMRSGGAIINLDLSGLDRNRHVRGGLRAS